MKGRPIDDISEIFNVLKKFDGRILCEIKYDGERAQIHYENGQIFSFSRSFEHQIEKYKNILERLKNHFIALGIKNCIIDCEIIGFDYSKSQILSFQQLQTKNESTNLEEKIFFFDVYYYNDKSFINEPFPVRRNQLLSSFKPTDFFAPAEGFELNLKGSNGQEEVVQQINDFLSESLQQGYEGIFIKTMDEKLSVYNGNSRVQWIKVKFSNNFSFLHVLNIS